MTTPRTDPPTDSWTVIQTGPTVHIWMDRDGTWHREELWPEDDDDE